MDSVFTAVHRNFALLDVVDEAWANDCLSDDGAYLEWLRLVFFKTNRGLTFVFFCCADIEVPHIAGQNDENEELNGKKILFAIAKPMLPVPTLPPS